MRLVMQLALVALSFCAGMNLAVAQIPPASAATPASMQRARAPFTAEMLKKFSPRANPEIVDAIIAQWPEATAAGIDTPREIHHFLAQLATESAGFRFMEENLSYKAKRLRQIFPKYFKSEEAAELFANKPEALAIRVYGGRLGNTCPSDGWDFRGSGLIQLTGRANFAARDKALKLNPKLVAFPNLARTSPTAFHIAVSYWSSRNINSAAARDDLTGVRRLVNGGTIGLKESGIWLAQARRFIRLPGDKSADDKSAGTGFDEPTSPGLFAAENQLVALGFLPTRGKSGGADKSAENRAATVTEAVKRFQASRDIPQTGQIDTDTIYELTDTGNFLERKLDGTKERSAPKGALPSFCL